MAETTQYTITHKELVTLIIKHVGVHDGRWWLLMSFGFSGGNFGPSPEQAVPGVAVGVQQIGIQRDTPEQPGPPALLVDAAQVNPRPKPESAKPQRSRKS